MLVYLITLHMNVCWLTLWRFESLIKDYVPTSVDEVRGKFIKRSFFFGRLVTSYSRWYCVDGRLGQDSMACYLMSHITSTFQSTKCKWFIISKSNASIFSSRQKPWDCNLFLNRSFIFFLQYIVVRCKYIILASVIAT